MSADRTDPRPEISDAVLASTSRLSRGTPQIVSVVVSTQRYKVASAETAYATWTDKTYITGLLVVSSTANRIHSRRLGTKRTLKRTSK